VLPVKTRTRCQPWTTRWRCGTRWTRLIADVYGGKVHPRIAAGLAPLLSMQLRAIETTDLERRMARLEKAMAKEAESSDKKDAPPRGPLEAHKGISLLRWLFSR
jgi:hypothetical protein